MKQRFYSARYATRLHQHRWETLPYGMWTCADGREVLFNRHYQPIWQRVNGTVSPADSTEWVSWTKQHWFYLDADTLPGRQHTALCRRLERLLATFRDAESVAGEVVR